MRKYLTILSIIIGISAYGQTNTFPANGNVGIGTLNPATQLNVVTPANGTTSTIKIGQAGDGGNVNVPLGAAAGGYNIDFAAWRDIVPDYIGGRIRAERINVWQDNNALVQAMDLAFFTGDASSSISEKLRIKYNGNIGIGTTFPLGKLDVSDGNGTGTIAYFGASNVSGANGIYFSRNTSATNPMNIQGSKVGVGAQNITLQVEGGNVGIGTTTPSQKLEINGNASVNGQIIAPGGLRLGSSIVDNVNNAPWYGLGNSNIMMGQNPAIQLACFGGLNFQTASGQMVIRGDNGNVGIGTINPTTKLAVNGIITTKEVNVTTVGWADYVFDSSYELKPLTTIANYIQQNKHLPNIPSAEEVSKNGVALGEMNKKLLEKVEELTLYAIKQNEEIKKQSEEIERLKKENEQFEQLKQRLEKLENKK